MMTRVWGRLFSRRWLGFGLVAAGLFAGAMDGCDATVTIDAPAVETGGPPAGLDVAVFDLDGGEVFPPTFFPEGIGPTGDPFPAPVLTLGPGCYTLQIDARSPGRPGVVVWYQSYTPRYEAELCVEADEELVVRARRLVSSASGSPPLAVGTIVDTNGAPVPGVGVDLFEPIDTISEADLQALTIADHQAFDYRAGYLESVSTDADGHYLSRWPTFSASCRVATLIAPAGLEFVATDSPFLNRTICPDETPPPTLSVRPSSG